MKIIDILKEDGLTLSFEVFPPKVDSRFEVIKEATEKIATIKPDFMSVTYGAGGGTSVYTLEIGKNIETKYNIPVISHLTAVSSDKETIDIKLKEMKDYGMENVLALRGDLTEELKVLSKEEREKLDFTYATDLVRKIKKSGMDFCIGGACYPEVHPESCNQKEDIENIKKKVDMGCEFLTTQMFFDNNLLYNFLYKIREQGVNVPVIAGIMPITKKVQLDRAIKLSNSFIPQRFKSLVDKFGDNNEAMEEAGIIYATDQIIDLYANGIKNVHVYTMNNYNVAKKIKDNLNCILYNY